VLGALLEGTALSEEELERDSREKEELDRKYGDGAARNEVEYRVEQRRNVFEDEQVDLSRYRVGKKDTGFVFPSVNTLIKAYNRFFFELTERSFVIAHLSKR